MLARRHVLPLLGGLVPAGAAAQTRSWPNRPIRLVVPFAPGGTQDLVARLLQPALAERLGQTVLVENRPGGATLIGSDAVAKAPPDGHTLLVAANSLTINATLARTPPFDARRDFVAVAHLCGAPHAFVAALGFRPNTVAEVVAAARAEPGRIAYGSTGTGGAHHLTSEAFKQAARIDLSHVPYRGGAPAIQDVLAGQIPLACVNLATALPLLREGRIKGLAVAEPARSALFPAMPSFAEAGYPAVLNRTWYGLVTRAGAPEEAIERMHEATNAVLSDPGVLARLEAQAVEALPMTRDAFAAFLLEEFERNARIVREGGITAD